MNAVRAENEAGMSQHERVLLALILNMTLSAKWTPSVMPVNVSFGRG